VCKTMFRFSHLLNRAPAALASLKTVQARLQGPLLQKRFATLASNRTLTTRDTFWLLASMGAIVGVGGIVLSGALTPTSERAKYSSVADYSTDYAGASSLLSGATTTAEAGFSEEVRARIRETYSYVAGSVGISAVAAFRAFRSPAIRSMNPMAFMIGSAVVSIGSLIATLSVSHTESPLLKHGFWALFAAANGVSLAPLGMLGGPLLMQAAVGTGCIVGSLSVVAASAPSEQFLMWGGPLTLGLGMLIGVGIGQIFLPHSRMLYNLQVYGGLALFGGMVLYDTQKVVHNAKHAREFDPVSSSIGVYLDMVNIFVRLVQILSNSNRKK